jgi:AP-3 complex subunit beta
VRELKLDILANLATDLTISSILAEFQAYVKDPNKAFVTATIQAIGRCAQMMPSIAESCLRGLTKLVSSPTESVVAQAVVVMRQLLQREENAHVSVIRSLVTFTIVLLCCAITY